jgi:ribosomal protein S18 acetylase RimI-like enzyme
MARLLAGTFSRRDPPALAVGLTVSEFEGMVRLFCGKAADEGLSIIARAAATGELAGALLAEDSAGAPPDGVDRLSAKFDPIFDILGQMDSEYRGGKPPPPGECLHLFLLGVDERFAGRGVARQLVAACLENGMRNGYRVAVTEATNPTSQHIFRRQGFIERVRRSYRDHRFDGRAVFASIADQGGPILMDRALAGRQAESP